MITNSFTAFPDKVVYEVPGIIFTYIRSNKKQDNWSRLDLLLRMGVFHTKFSIRTPEFLIFL